MSDTVQVMLCVNDYRNGVFCGRCSGVEIDDFIRLEPVVLPEPSCTLRAGSFSIHRHKFPVLAHAGWVGNWCWDAIGVTPRVAARLVATLLAKRWSSKKYDSGVVSVWGIDQADGDQAISIMDRHSRQETISEDEVYRALTASIKAVRA